MRNLSFLFASFMCAAFVPGCSGCNTDPGVDEDLSGGGDPNDRGKPIEGLLSIELSPTAYTNTVDPAALKSQAFTATGKFDGQADRDITGLVAWSFDNTAIGAIDVNGVFSESGKAAGSGFVKATAGSIIATAPVTLKINAVIKDPNAPMNAPDLFPPGTTPVTGNNTSSPVIVYPSTETRFPKNFYNVTFQWQPKGNDLFRLTFTSPNVTLTIYTTGNTTTTTTHDRFTFDAAAWALLANSNPGATVTWTVAAVKTVSPSTVYGSADAVVGFSKFDVPGAIYYWSTSNPNGVRHATLGNPTVEAFLTNGYPDINRCVGCHTVSRNGKRLVADFNGEGNMGVVNVMDRSRVVDWKTTSIGAGWQTFNPDLSRIVRGKNGVLTLLDGNTGATVGANAGVIPLPMNRVGLHPDWSPDGTNVLFSLAESGGTRGGSKGSIARIPYNNGAWDANQIETLVQSTGTNDNNYYPMYSFDGKYIAFVKSEQGNNKSDTAKLWLFDTVTKAMPVALVAGNQVVSNVMKTGNMAKFSNTMPTWAPSASNDLYFVAFSSKREYGVVTPSDDATVQLWVMGVDPTKSGDPSYPAFYLTFQEIGEDNHRPFWTEDVFVPSDGGTPPPLDLGPCLSLGSSCSVSAECCSPQTCQDVGEGVYQCQN